MAKLNDVSSLRWMSAWRRSVSSGGRAATLARRAIIEHAIQLIRPVPERDDNLSLISPAQNDPFAAIRTLGAFERFVFVMSILEGWSERDCALRLGCSRRGITTARLLALESVGSADALYTQADATIAA